MDPNHLQKLNTAIKLVVAQRSYADIIEGLKTKLEHSEEPFVWFVIHMESLACDLPENIRSAWIFVLKEDVPSGCHYHPNSIQHMVMVEGQGQSRVGESQKRMVKFGSAEVFLNDVWYVIGENVPHEFFPEETDMVVVSFHTCRANELEEIACGTHQRRLYEQ